MISLFSPLLKYKTIKFNVILPVGSGNLHPHVRNTISTLRSHQFERHLLSLFVIVPEPKYKQTFC